MTARKRILFVDDEPAILAALQNLLFRERKRWDLVFVNGGELALSEFRKAPFDVIVSDMRMPGLDGASLLTRIKEEYPQTVRIMLSGHAQKEALVRALPSLHQLLSKPCDAATLRGVLERCVEVAGLATTDAVKSIVGRLDKLPSPPAVFHELTSALDSPSSSVRDVAKIVARDPAVCAKVLQLVNSSYFQVGHGTVSIDQAVSFLGTERLQYLLLTAAVFGPGDRAFPVGFSLQSIQETAVRCARLAEQMVTKTDRPSAFAAALLHDIGRIVLAVGIPEAYPAILAREPEVGLCQAEHEALSATHAQVGACLLEIWGLPRAIVEVVKAHHDPSTAPEPYRALACAVHVASALAGSSVDSSTLDFEAVARAGFSDRVGPWCAIAEGR